MSDVEISFGDYRAAVSPVGASLVALTYRGRALVRDLGGAIPRPRYRGAVLAPWPNRIRDGRYRYDGADQQLAITEPERDCALHGLLAWHAWPVRRRSADEVVLADTIWPQPGYPYSVEVTARYTLASDGLVITVSARNVGDRTAPYGASTHPYLVGGDGGVDDWTFTLPARSVLLVDPDRLLPTGSAAVDGTAFDFRAPRTIGATELDHAFGDVEFGADGCARATLTGADGSGVAISWDAASPWVQVHTTDHVDPEVHRSGLAVEPMTCPPDAFNSGVDLVQLPPGGEHVVSWRLSALP